MKQIPGPTRRPGLRAGVLGISGILVVGTALLVSANVSGHLQETAVDQAVRSTEAVVRGYIDPSVANGALERLVSAGKILRIKVWAPDGTIVFSDLPALRGRQFPVEDDLHEALDG